MGKGTGRQRTGNVFRELKQRTISSLPDFPDSTSPNTSHRQHKDAGPFALALLLLLLVVMALGGCVARENNRTSGQDLVERSLNDSANVIMADLARLTGSYQNYAAQSSTGSLRTGPLHTHMDLTYEGPLAGALEKICARIGYRLVEKGKQRTAPILVHVRAKDTEVLQILRLIGLQTSAGEEVRVLEDKKVIELIWLTQDEIRARPRQATP